MRFSATSLLRRKTSGGNFIPEIDGLRFFAIFTVLIFHFNTALSKEFNLDWVSFLPIDQFDQVGWWIARLDLGVKVFFGISGFILAVPFIQHFFYEKKPVDLKYYFYRRLTRLEPPFVVTLIIFSLVHIFILREEWSYILPHFFASLFYLHTIIYEAPSLINPVTWSLETEVQYYVLIPFLSYFIFFRKSNSWTLLVLFLLISFSVLAKNYIYSHDTPGWDYTVLVFLSNFLVGFLFALVYLRYKAYFLTKSFWYDGLGLIAIFALFFFYKPQVLISNNILFNSSIFLLFVSVFKGKVFNWFFTLPIVYLIGGMCYTIYLIHYPFFHLWVKIFGSLSSFDGYLANLSFQLLLGIPMVLLLSAVFFVLIEKPCMDKDWPAKFMDRMRIRNLEKK